MGTEGFEPPSTGLEPVTLTGLCYAPGNIFLDSNYLNFISYCHYLIKRKFRYSLLFSINMDKIEEIRRLKGYKDSILLISSEEIAQPLNFKPHNNPSNNSFLYFPSNSFNKPKE